MKKLIAILRITGILSFLAFFVLQIILFNQGNYDFAGSVFNVSGSNPLTKVAFACSGTAVFSFLIIVLLQCYNIYIKSYLQPQEAEDEIHL